MKKVSLIVVIAVLIFACNNQLKEKETSTETNQKTTTEKEDNKFGRNNYAIIWEWTTTDKKLVEDNYKTIIEELLNLWENDIIENTYFNPDAKINKFEYYPNISVFLKAKSINEAEKILNNLTLAKKGIAQYKIYPVGSKWLGRNTDKISEKGITKSYVAIWSTQKDIDQIKDAELIQEQAGKIMDLYEDGTIENVYWELSGEPDALKRRQNEIADFVFFVNASTQQDAKKICDNLPLTQQNFTKYKLLPVGVFWWGNYKDNK